MNTTTAVNNAATVGNLYEAFGRGDIPYILNYITDDCKWIGAGEGLLPQGGTFIGKGVVNFFTLLDEVAEFTSFNPTSISNLNDNEVVAFGNYTGSSKITGKPSSSEWVMHWKFNDDGKVVYFQDYFDTAGAYVANQP